MADKSGRDDVGDDDGDANDMRPLLRLGAWGGCAVIALGVAVLTSRSEFGGHRIAAVLAALGQPATPAAPSNEPLLARAAAAEAEAKQLADTVRRLAADREQLAGRIATLERHLSDLTGAIAKPPVASHAAVASDAPLATAPETVVASAPAAAETSTPPDNAAVPPVPAADEPADPARRTVPLPRPPPLALIHSYVSPAAPAATTTAAAPPARVPPAPAARGEFAVDLGGGGSVEALRANWNQLKTKHAALFEGLQPLVLVRAGRPSGTERRLIVGPLATPTAVARVCAALTAAGSACTPAVYDGQRLALR